MKEAIIIDLNGFMTDVTLVADDTTGVFPFYRVQEPQDQFQEDLEQQVLTNTEILGYVVAIPVPSGLYKPKFDVEAWNEYCQLQLVELNDAENSRTDMTAYFNYSPKSEITFWIEGLKQEEIIATQNQHSFEQTGYVLATKLPKKKHALDSVWSRLWKK